MFDRKPEIKRYEHRPMKFTLCKCTHLMDLHNFLNGIGQNCLECKCPKAELLGQFTFDEMQNLQHGDSMT